MKNFLEKIGQDVSVFKSSFDFIKDLVFLMEVDEKNSLRYIYLNNSALKILNLNESVFGSRIEEILSENQSKLLIQKYKLVQSTKKPIEFTNELITEKGDFIGETSLSPILTEEGECRFILAIVRDITERKQNEQKLKENQKRLNSLIEHNGDAVFELNLDGNFISTNNMVTEITGYNKQDLIGRSFVPLIVNNYLEDTAKHFQSALRGSNEGYETAIYHKNGHTIQLFVKNVPIVIDGILIGVYGIAKDITEQKKMERLLRESEEKYRHITENAFDIIKLISPSGVVQYASPSNEKILGYSYSEFVGHSYLEYIHPDDVLILKERFNQYFQGSNSSVVKVRVRHKLGHYIWLETTTTPIKENGQVQQFVTIARDITERERLRDKLEKAAFYDYLSGLPNRRVFNERLKTAIHQADDSNMKVAVMMLDGWKFKQINDTYGHDAGDAVIVEMAKRLQRSVGDTDTVARLGGDEMAIILPNIESVQGAVSIAQQIISSFEEPLYLNGEKIQMGVGIGIAFYPDHTLDKRLLLKYADKALYNAKELGRNTFKIYKE